LAPLPPPLPLLLLKLLVTPAALLPHCCHALWVTPQ
jgi:hypothetical protein